MTPLRALVCDLDNTLYDWVGYFVPAFYSMIDKAVEILGCDRERLLDDCKKVHQFYGDSEHPFALLDTDTVLKKYDGDRGKAATALDPAFYAFNTARKSHLHLYPTVIETLEKLRQQDITLVAHTESKYHAVADRLRRLGLTNYFSRVYCREKSEINHPKGKTSGEWLGDFPTELMVELSHHQRKPDPDVLLEICSREGIAPKETAYIGDSIARDIMMARAAGVTAIWAAYGAPHPDLYASLVRVTHWSSEDVAREARLREQAKSVQPDLIAHRTFSEIMPLFEVGPIEYRSVINYE
jgi:FMN phosphatase YigB (HAD superfamily)